MSTHNLPFSIYKRKSALIIPNLRLLDFIQRTQERVRNSRGKRAISVRATEDLLFFPETTDAAVFDKSVIKQNEKNNNNKTGN